MEVFDIDRHYDHPTNLVEIYKEQVESKFKAHPDLRAELLSFTR